MGTIVINQTDCKQNVVLQSSLDGITGGYYDAAGVWHGFGDSNAPKYSIMPGSHTFSSGNWAGQKIEVSDNGTVTFTNKETPYTTYAIIDNVYFNDASANTTNIGKTGTAIIPELKVGDEVELKVKNIVSTLGEGNHTFAVALRRGSTSYCSSGNIDASQDTEKTASYTMETDVVIPLMFIYCDAGILTLSFNVELYVNGVRYI